MEIHSPFTFTFTLLKNAHKIVQFKFKKRSYLKIIKNRNQNDVCQKLHLVGINNLNNFILQFYRNFSVKIQINYSVK